MKRFYNLSLLMAVIFFATSCMTPKPFAGQFQHEKQKGKDTSAEVFVVTKDGEKIAGKKLQFSHAYAWKVKTELEWVAVDGKKIPYGKYEAVQTANAYQVLYNPGQPAKYPYGVFIDRIRFGKINLYEYQPLKANDGRNKKVPDHEYVFQKHNGKTELLDYNSFALAISDNIAATQKLKELFPAGIIGKSDVAKTLKNLTEVAEIYNAVNAGSPQVSK
jgi:hypothetical protein